MKVLTIVGARPQFIKAAVVSAALKKEKINEIIIHTGQHYDYNMSALFFKELKIHAPKYNLGIGARDRKKMIAQMCVRIEKRIKTEKPSCVLVYGDTNSTLAGALAAKKCRIPVAHIEAGLRSYNNNMPEEINRIATDKISDLLFCPTKTAVKNLKKEGKKEEVKLTGDVMYDALLTFLPVAQRRSKVLRKLRLKKGSYFLVTLHRAENTNSKRLMTSIFRALFKLAEYKKVILPLHPRTKKYLVSYGLLEEALKKIQIIDPVGYLDNLLLMKNAAKICTDSGGMQKEAYLLKVPCLTLRGETEWVETVKSGWNVITGADSRKIFKEGVGLKRKLIHPDLYGDGKASLKIVKLLKEKYA
ncbi:MAG: UDP-N-acetylglucosamine 2-epimerase (non-hydrolyzing) [Candidatus Firestonebacteria bacterium]